MNSAVDDDNKMNHNSIVVYPSNNGLGEARPSTISATTTKGTEWMTDDVKRTFIVQFRKYGTVKQRRFLNRKYKDVTCERCEGAGIKCVTYPTRIRCRGCMPTRVCSRVEVITRFRVIGDMNITAAQYQDLFSWYIQVKNQVDYGLPKNIRFCSMYTDSETFKDTIAKKRISNEEANVSKEEGEDNKSGETNICRLELNQCSMLNESHYNVQVKNFVNEQVIMDQGIDGIEYTSIGSRSGQRIPDEDFHPETHMLHNSECSAMNQVMDCTATIGAMKSVNTLAYDPQSILSDNQDLVQYRYPSSVVTVELGTAYFPHNFDQVTCSYEDRVHVPGTTFGSESFSYGQDSARTKSAPYSTALIGTCNEYVTRKFAD